MVECAQCKGSFDAVEAEQRYCSRKCRKDFQNELRRSRKNAFKNITMDAIFERAESDIDVETPNARLSTPTTRADEALRQLNSDRLTSLLSTGARYSESTLKKHVWVMKLYSGFCTALEVEPWPLDPVISSGFVRFLGLDAKYAVASIEDVIVPSLKRMHIENCDEAVPTEVSQYLSQAIRDVKNSKTHIRGSDGKEPAIVNDVKRIIDCIPEGHPDKAKEASLFLTSLSTGARAVTCHNVCLEDIVSVYAVPESSRLIVQLRFRVTKGNPNWNHIVSLEGDPFLKSSLNIVYWLRQHLLVEYALDLINYDSWNSSIFETIGNKKLWPYSKDSMRELFKSRAVLAGFPHELFSFHSLRAGFLCSALLKAGTDSSAVKAVLESTAFVAGWVPNQNAQLRYVKTCAKKTIVSSRLIMPSEESHESNVVDPILMSSEAFHGISLSESSWDIETNYNAFYNAVEKSFTVAYLNETERKALRDKCWRNAYNAYVLNNPSLEREAKNIYENKPAWKIPRTKWSTETITRMHVGRKHIASLLNSNFEALHGLVENFVSFVRSELDLSKPLRIHNYPKKTRVDDAVIVREKLPISGHRKRIPWTREEDQVLVQERMSGQSWVNISQLLEGRSNVDCKDRLRNLIKKFGDLDDVIASFRNQ